MDYSNLTIEEFRTLVMKRWENPLNSLKEQNISSYKKFRNKTSGCSDEITIYVKIENNKVIDSLFDGSGCIVSISVADFIIDEIKEKEISEVKIILENYFKMISGEEYNKDVFKYLNMYKNIYKQKNRKKCSRLAADALLNVIGE